MVLKKINSSCYVSPNGPGNSGLKPKRAFMSQLVSVLGSESKAFRPGYESSYYIKSKVSVNISPRLLRGLEIIGPRLFWVVVLFTKDPELDPGLRARA